MKRKVCVVIVNRANYARIKTALLAIQAHPDLELQLIVGSSAVLEDYGNVSCIIEDDGFAINARLYTALAGTSPLTMAKSTGLLLTELPSYFDQLKPDVVLTVADRYEILAVAAATSYMNIPLAHTQGGEVTGSIDNRVRHAVTQLADLHFPATERGEMYLRRMGVHEESIWRVGCPSIDLVRLLETENHFDQNSLLRYPHEGTIPNIAEPFFLVLQHPVTTEYEILDSAMHETLCALRSFRLPSLLLMPNIDAGSARYGQEIRRFFDKETSNWLGIMRNVSPEDYIHLLRRTAVIIGNSSSGIRESSFLGTPSVNIGNRQQGRERSFNVLDVAEEEAAIIAGINFQLEHGHYSRSLMFGDGYSGERIAKVLANVDLAKLQRERRLSYL